jgi:hypothetical protein
MNWRKAQRPQQKRLVQIVAAHIMIQLLIAVNVEIS